MSIPQRTCSKCKQSFPLTDEYWHKDKRDPHGFCWACKECARQRARQWCSANRERDRANARRWYHANPDKRMEYRESHREQIAAIKRNWRKNHPEEVKRYKSESQKRHRDSNNRRNRLYTKRHPDKIRKRTRIQQAQRRSLEGKYTQADIDALYEEQCELCAYCGIRLHGVFHVDHIIPVARNGTNYPENLLLACPQCNYSKNDKLIHEWQAIRGW